MRCRPAEAAPPPPPPPGFPAGAELQAHPPQSGRSPPRAASGILEDGFQAPSSPMVDPEGGNRDRSGSACVRPGAAQRLCISCGLASSGARQGPLCILYASFKACFFFSVLVDPTMGQ